MKIDPQNIPQSNGAGASQQTQQADQVNGGRGSAVFAKGPYGLGADSVQLSNLSAAVRVSTTGSPERTSALNELGKDVQTGRYRIDNQAVSHGIIADAMIP